MINDQRLLAALEYPEIRERVKGYCSFSGGQELIAGLLPDDSFLAVSASLELSRDALRLTYAYGPLPFPGIREIRPAVGLACRGGIIGIADLQSIAAHNSGVRGCVQYLAKAGASEGPVSELVSSLGTFDALADQISRCIGPDGTINDNASAGLAGIRKKLRDSLKELDQATKRYLAVHAADLMDDITAQRNDRQVVLAKASFRNSLGGIQYGESTSGSAVYLEPGELVPFNNAVQDLKNREAREIEAILRGLSRSVAANGAQLLANMETLSLLDAAFAKAQYGKDLGGAVGELSDNSDLVIEQGWHPLLDPKRAVRNDYHLQDPCRILLITGPNTGGKTVSLKTIGLLALMTYAGIPVPASRAVIPLYDRIFVDIGDAQSITESLSTFSAHMASLAGIFAEAGPNSLVIIDELCSGTDPAEGENLAIAVLEHFRAQKVFFAGSTHYGKLRSYAREHPEVLIASMAFDLDKLEPTYHYREGSIGQSNAFDIAARYGFPPEVLDRARQLKEQGQSEQERLLDKLSREEAANELAKAELAAAIAANAQLRDKYLRDAQELEQRREQVLAEAREAAAGYLEERQDEADGLIRELKEMTAYDLPKTIRIRRRLDQLSQGPEAAAPAPEPDLKPGDQVRIIRTNQIGKILEIDRHGAAVEVRGMTVKTSLDGLRRDHSQPKPPKRTGRGEYLSAGSFSSEINLIGLRVAEALPLLDKYLDEAIVHHAAFVRVIHGFGTGKLKAAVWEALKRSPNVASYELADPASGGSGATIVYFRKG